MSKDIVEYWNNYYQSRNGSLKPSDFAHFILNRFPAHETLVDIGCGDGRDALWFASQGLNVIGFDASNVAIDKCNYKAKLANLSSTFYSLEIGKCSIQDRILTLKLDLRKTLIYARFLLHAITEEEEELFLKEMSFFVSHGSYLCLEARSEEDAFLPKVEPLHFRRFVDRQKIAERCLSLGIHIEMMQCSRGLAPYGFEDPSVIRMICSGGKDV